MVTEVKSLNEECGVFGVWGIPDASRLTYFGLHSLQHRGQEGAGTVDSIGLNFDAPYNGLYMAYFTVRYLTPLYDYEADYLKSLEKEKTL